MVKQRGNNSCLFHSLSFCLSYDGIVSDIHEDLSGFVLREQICCYLRDNEDVVISISPDEQRTMSEAVGMDRFTCSSYYVKMMNIVRSGVQSLRLQLLPNWNSRLRTCSQKTILQIVGKL